MASLAPYTLLADSVAFFAAQKIVRRHRLLRPPPAPPHEQLALGQPAMEHERRAALR